MTEKPNPHAFQFSLRALLGVMTIAAAFFTGHWIGHKRGYESGFQNGYNLMEQGLILKELNMNKNAFPRR